MGWYFFLVYRCDYPPHWEPAFVKGPEFRSENAARRYAEDLTEFSSRTESKMIVNTWRHYGRPGDQWHDLGWSAQSCP